MTDDNLVYAVFAVHSGGEGGGLIIRCTRWKATREEAEAVKADMLARQERTDHPEDYVPLEVYSQIEAGFSFNGKQALENQANRDHAREVLENR
jgi:hypothetical protein